MKRVDLVWIVDDARVQDESHESLHATREETLLKNSKNLALIDIVGF